MRILFLCALPIIIMTPVIPILFIYLPKKIGGIFIAIVAIYVALILITLTISLYFSPNKKNILVAIPVTFVMGLFGLIIYKLKVYMLLLNAFSIGQPFMLTAKEVDETMDLIGPITIVGVWIVCLPVIVYTLHLSWKSGKNKNYENNIKGQAYIRSVSDSQTKINHNKVYRIELDIRSAMGDNYSVEKDFIVPNHILHTISIGNTVDVLIDPKNPKKVHIQTAYGVL